MLVLLPRGNQHTVKGMLNRSPLHLAQERLKRGVYRYLTELLDELDPSRVDKCFLLQPPPPIGDESHIRAHPGSFKDVIQRYPFRPKAERLQLWHIQCEATREVAVRFGFGVIEVPPEVRTDDGFLAPEAYGSDPSHGNTWYGRAILNEITKRAQRDDQTGIVTNPRPKHVYSDLPDSSYWKQSISNVPAGLVDPVVQPRFTLSAMDKVATAGSCFAQHIAKRLRDNDFTLLKTEAERHGEPPYDFSARFGNIYTARQLLQLFDQAFGDFVPSESVWQRPDGSYCDPFRPRIREQGYATTEALAADRDEHLEAVRRMFLEVDVFVFTLGLTEAWRSRRDGAVYPIAPGVAGGEFDPASHEFVNFRVSEVVDDLVTFIDKLRGVNNNARILFTVSPVPLVATKEDRHVLESTVYSKSLLRVAAEEAVMARDGVEYFPSYEIITGPHAPYTYFTEDRRGVAEDGVDHVMSVFMSRMTDMADTYALHAADPEVSSAEEEIEQAMDAACDEELLAKD